MNLKEVAEKEYLYNIENELIPYGGNSPKRVLESIVRDVAGYVFGFYKPLIEFGTYADSGSYDCDGELTLAFNIKGCGDYQYNSVIFNSDTFEFKENKKDGTEIINKLFQFIDLISYDDYVRWSREMDMDEVGSFAYEYKCTLESDINKYVDLSKEDEKKLKKAFKRHRKISNLPLDELKPAIEKMLKFWEDCNIEDSDSGWLNSNYTINLDNELPKFKKVEKVEPIFYPRGSRGQYCSIITLVERFQDILHLKTGDEVTLKKFGSKEKTVFTVIDDTNNDFIAVKEKGSNDVEFLGDLDTAKDCYDALFDCNKEDFKDWKNNRYHIVK